MNSLSESNRLINNLIINPGAYDIPGDGIDQDCDGSDLECLPDPADVDDDGDTYTENEGDFNDSDASVYPGAIEICNSIDDNCNNQVDENIQFNFYFEDADGDSFGDPTSTISFCTLPFGYVSNNSDCDDNSSFISPLGTEVCNLLDDNCNGLVDEGVQTIL